MNIILCGMPKSGKTTIGNMIAQKLHWNFIDTDERVEQIYHSKTNSQLSTREIYIKEGNKQFRILEKQAISMLNDSTNTVIATGGGVVLDRSNRAYLHALGTVFYLKVPVKVLWQRIQADSIPAILDKNEPEKSFYVLEKQRSKMYEEIAHCIIDTENLTREQVVLAILEYRKHIDGK